MIAACEPAPNFEISVIVPAEAMPFFERAFDGDDVALLANEIEEGENAGKWSLSAIYESKPDLSAIDAALEIAATCAGIEEPACKTRVIEQKNWLKESLISFQPVDIGRYYVYGSHIKDPPPKDKIALKIDAATAFGSGEHFTTKGCLTAMQDISQKRSARKILDMGCGSGILSLAAAHTFHCPIFATDIDAEAVRVTKANAKANNVAQFITAWHGDGYKPAKVRQNAPYDLVFSNILARPLTLMAKDLAKVLADDGLAVLSGMLENQEDWVVGAHAEVGLHLRKRYRLNGWTTLIVSKQQ